MINGFSLCNNVSGTYRSNDDIKNFKFIVKCKEVNKVIPLPNFEAFASHDKNPEKDLNEHYEEIKLSWQEKILSSREIYLYKDSTNCKTDIEKNYHTLIEEQELKSTIHSPKIFTFVQDDKFTCDSYLTSHFECLENIGKKLEKLWIHKDDESLDDSGSIFKDTSSENKDDGVKDDTVRMFVMLDMNNSENDPTFLLNREHILFQLSWHPTNGILSISPDLNDLHLSPYVLETSHYSKQVFHYSIQHDGDGECPDDAKLAEMQLMEKYHESQHSIQNAKLFKNFEIPPKNILKCLYVIEIISANVTEYLQNLYVEYTIDLPFGYMTGDPLKGVTQMAKPKSDGLTHFGHVFELCFLYQMGISTDESDLPQEPDIYFEIISCDVWGRHRTEGYCSSKLPVTQPGRKRDTLQCIRPLGPNHRLWEMNRFFIGGKHVLEDLTWLTIPSVLEGERLNKYGVKTIASGVLELSTNIILQSKNFTKQKSSEGESSPGGQSYHRESVADKLTADSLFKSVNMVLQAYKHAKDKLANSQEEQT